MRFRPRSQVLDTSSQSRSCSTSRAWEFVIVGTRVIRGTRAMGLTAFHTIVVLFAFFKAKRRKAGVFEDVMRTTADVAIRQPPLGYL